ncbi:hypothetical protein N2152v2_009749 [Parachlorella kessleri]
MAQPSQQTDVLGLAVQEVLQGYSTGGASLPAAAGYTAFYEQHFDQVHKLADGSVHVDVARQHFSSLLQDEAVDTILASVQQGSPADHLSREQFLTLTHLVSCTLAAAQTSEALWADPVEPTPSTHKKRHPTVQECLGDRLTAALEGGRSSSLSRAPDSFVDSASGQEHGAYSPAKLPRSAHGGASKENLGSAANQSPLRDGAAGQLQRAGSRKSASPSRRHPGLRAWENGQDEVNPVIGQPAGDVSDFERKLQNLMRKMQQDQARLQGKLAGSAAADVVPEAHLAPAPDGVQVVETASEATARSSPAGSWESFKSSPAAPALATAPAPAVHPFIAGIVASTTEEQELAQPSPFSELNPIRSTQQGVTDEDEAAVRGVTVGYPVSAPLGAGYGSPAGSVAREAPLYPTPATALPGAAAVPGFSTPQAQRGNRFAAGGLDAAALTAAMQQLSVQQALALAQQQQGALQQGGFLEGVDAAAVARAQVQLEAAAAQLVAVATARPHYSPAGSNSGGSADRGSMLSRGSSLDTAAGASRQAPFTARDHHVQANAPRLARHMTAPAHTLGPLGAAAEQRQASLRPSRFSHQQQVSGAEAAHPEQGGSAPLTARAAVQSDVVELSAWPAMPVEDLQHCQRMFETKGYEKLGGMALADAQQLFARLRMAPHLFAPVFSAADADKDGLLCKQEFCLFMYLLRMVQRGFQVPASLTSDQVAHLLGLQPQQRHQPPAAPRVQGSAPSGAHAWQQEEQQSGAMKLDLVKIKNALRPGGQQPGAAAGHSYPLQDEQEAYSDSDDSGFDDSLSITSRCSSRLPGMQSRANPSVRPQLQPGLSQRHPALEAAAHSRLVISIRGANIHYSKPLEKPFFNISVRDPLLRVVEIPQDTPPGHWHPGSHSITLNHPVELQTQLMQLPRGSVVYFEVKHFKSREGRMSTLAWSYISLEKVLDFGPVTCRVREASLSLPLFSKPVDYSLRRLKRIGRRDDIKISVAGLA